MPHVYMTNVYFENTLHGYTCSYIIGLLIQHGSDGSSQIFNGAATRAWSF
jgi:hypothetical protein